MQMTFVFHMHVRITRKRFALKYVAIRFYILFFSRFASGIVVNVHAVMRSLR